MLIEHADEEFVDEEFVDEEFESPEKLVEPDISEAKES
jgi:hypothetical protein